MVWKMDFVFEYQKLNQNIEKKLVFEYLLQKTFPIMQKSPFPFDILQTIAGNFARNGTGSSNHVFQFVSAANGNISGNINSLI